MVSVAQRKHRKCITNTLNTLSISTYHYTLNLDKAQIIEIYVQRNIAFVLISRFLLFYCFLWLFRKNILKFKSRWSLFPVLKMTICLKRTNTRDIVGGRWEWMKHFSSNSKVIVWCFLNLNFEIKKNIIVFNNGWFFLWNFNDKCKVAFKITKLPQKHSFIHFVLVFLS